MTSLAASCLKRLNKPPFSTCGHSYCINKVTDDITKIMHGHGQCSTFFYRSFFFYYLDDMVYRFLIASDLLIPINLHGTGKKAQQLSSFHRLFTTI